MKRVHLYLDEDVDPLLARVLRQRGFDVVSVHETGTRSASDTEQFVYAAQQERAIFTFNVKDFIPIASDWMRDGRAFHGLVLSRRMVFSELLPRFVRMLRTKNPAELANNIIWLSAFESSAFDAESGPK